MNRMLLTLCLAIALVLTSCGGGGGGGSTPPPPTVTLTVTQTSSPYGLIGQPFPGLQVAATGGTAPYTFSATSVPAGMAFSSDGKLTGNTPPTEGNYIVVVTASDSAGHTGSGTINFATYLPLDATINATEVNSGSTYTGSLFVRMNQGNLTVTARVASGTFPTGLTLGPTGGPGANPVIAITGTPTQSGIFNFTVELKDSLTPPRISQVPLKILVDVQELRILSGSPLNQTPINRPYVNVFAVSGGIAPYSCGLAPGSGSLPPGLAPSTNCSIAGTPTQIGKFDFTWQVSDNGTQQQTTTKAFSLTVFEPMTVADLPDATTGESYSAPLQITGGVPPYTISTVNAFNCCFTIEKHDFTVHGVPYVPGLQGLSLVIGDSGGQLVNAVARLNVSKGPFRLGPDDLPRMKLNQFYSGTLSVVSGQRPINWAIESGALPPTLVPNSNLETIQIFGFPNAAGTYPVTLTATDSSTPPQVLHIPLSLQVFSKLPRNDSIALSDTLLTTDTFHSGSATRTISPYSDPVDLTNTDQDYYQFRAFAGETIEASATAGLISGMDPAIEILDVNGQRFNTCRDVSDDTPDSDGNVDLTPLAFDDACRNDDIELGVNVNSKLLFRVPGASGTMVDLYLHVVDFRGDARPDFQYQVTFTHVAGGSGLID